MWVRDKQFEGNTAKSRGVFTQFGFFLLLSHCVNSSSKEIKQMTNSRCVSLCSVIVFFLFAKCTQERDLCVKRRRVWKVCVRDHSGSDERQAKRKQLRCFCRAESIRGKGSEKGSLKGNVMDM